MNFFLIYMFYMGLFCLILIRKHILLCLISLEFVVLSLLLVIFIFCLSFSYSFYLYLIMMTFYVCEGALGLSILVYMIRCHGNDYLSGMFLW
uniref:NADH-ubiquinone oxidoreductase chain 4L n=2 Tax=Warodia TaxID=2509960 RepID=A0A9E6XT79_9HEMI|nr:NADH dehydrogenase subunit 4L [Warodia hoso]YP_010582996.1 NADH dehydrogenase subunit 4L [Warodia lineata]UGN61429.1 NADH dehydrogenase subunit 4L [Warodia hoso]UGN61442.1 NADH dehydrogenase subunit 4L [Warodia lineata]WRY72457.1 NADH dehydrogenase subunit 4L [Warodia biguttata]